MCDCGDKECDYEEGRLYWHEALHTASLAVDFFSDNVELHPAVTHDKELKEAAERITKSMADFYQMVGRKYHTYEVQIGEE